MPWAARVDQRLYGVLVEAQAGDWPVLEVTHTDGQTMLLSVPPAGRDPWERVGVAPEVACTLWRQLSATPPRAGIGTGRDPRQSARDLQRRVIEPGWEYLAQVTAEVNHRSQQIAQANENTDALAQVVAGRPGWRWDRTRPASTTDQLSVSHLHHHGPTTGGLNIHGKAQVGASGHVELTLSGVPNELAARVLDALTG